MKPLDRRTFLQTGLGSAIAATSSLSATAPIQAEPASQQAPALAAGLPDVVIVGAGAFGVWTALTLRERGATVTLLDAFGPGNSRATSGDETRQIRAGYGDREIYSRWALEAIERWKQREREWNRRLLYPTGRLQLAAGWTPDLEAQKKVFERLGIRYEMLAHDELVRRYPQVNFEGVSVAFFEPGSGLLKARDAIIAASEAFERKGGVVRVSHATPGRAAGRRLEALALDGRESLSTGAVVFACGPWLRKLFPDFMGSLLSTPRAEVFYFGPPPGDTRFTWPNLPCLSEPGAGYYAYPCIDRGLKIAPSVGGVLQVDPDTQERIVSPYMTKRARDLVARRYPGLKDQPIVETRVCQLEYSPDLHFLIDRHPAFDNVWIAGAGSGHGFKHGPVIGEYVADRIMGHAADPATAQLFALKTRLR